MSLKDALAAAEPKRPGGRCSVGRLLATLDKADASALDAACKSDMQHTQIARALKAEGHHVDQGAIGRHRRGLCFCE